jgi:hypothetical protein
MPFSSVSHLVVTLVCILLLLNSGCAMLLGYYAAARGVEDVPVGRWRYSPSAWATAGSVFGLLAVIVFFVYHRRIVSAGQLRLVPLPRLQGVALAVAIPASVATLLLTISVENRCNAPDRLAALERVARGSKDGATLQSFNIRSTETYRVNLFTNEAVCRAEVDITKTDGAEFPRSGIWYRVFFKESKWFTRIGPVEQAHEEKYLERKAEELANSSKLP